MITLITTQTLALIDPKKAKRIENLRKANKRPSNGVQTSKVKLGYVSCSFL